MNHSHKASSIFSWGKNDYHQLAHGLTNATNTLSTAARKKLHVREPKLADELENIGVVDAAAGRSHTVMIDEFGNVWTIGRGKEGQLGLNDRMDRFTPTKVMGELESHRVVGAACGEDNTAVITEDGSLFEWGLLHYIPASRTNQGGRATDPSVAMPGLAAARPVSERLKKLLFDSTMQYLNDNPHADDSLASQLPSINEEDSRQRMVDAGILSVRTQRKVSMIPTKCMELNKIFVVSVAFGYGHTLVLAKDGFMYSKGYNDRGQLGLGNRVNQIEFQRIIINESMTRLQNVEDGVDNEESNAVSTRIISISCGNSHNICLSESGHVFGFGSNSLGQLGLGLGFRDQMSPIVNNLLYLIAGKIVDVTAGSNHSSALSSENALYSWGHAEYGQQGGSSVGGDLQFGANTDFYHTPREVPPFTGDGPKLLTLSSGYLFTVALDSEGNVWSWGWDSFGALGRGVVLGQHPSIVAKLQHSNVTKVVAGNQHVVALVQVLGSRSALALRPLFIQEDKHAPSWLAEMGSHHDVLIMSKHHTWKKNQSETKTAISKHIGSRDPIKAHQFIIYARCKQLLDANKECNDGVTTIVLDGAWEPLVVKALVEYLYTDDIRSCPPHRLLDLSKLADSLDIDRLKILAAAKHKQSIIDRGLFGSRMHQPEENPNKNMNDVPESTFHSDMLFSVNRKEYADVSFRILDDDFEPKTAGSGETVRAFNQSVPLEMENTSPMTSRDVENPPDNVEEVSRDHTNDSVKDVDGIQSKSTVNTEKQSASPHLDVESKPDVPETAFAHQVNISTDQPAILSEEGKKESDVLYGNRVLLSQYPFFRKLLNSTFSEALELQKGKPVPLTGVSRPIFATMLEWIYTGNGHVVNEDNVLEMLVASRCFGLDRLAGCCENFIIDNLDEENVDMIADFAEVVVAPRVLYECKLLRAEEKANA